MLGALRTPTLRCVAKRPSFMHTGQMQALEQVIDFLSAGGDPHGFVGKNELLPLALGPGDKSDLVAFLRALDGANPSSGQAP
jgi:cytochrome c peroxidase